MTNALPNTSLVGDSESGPSHQLDNKNPEPLPVSNAPKLSSAVPSPTTSDCPALDSQGIMDDVASGKGRLDGSESVKDARILENGDEPSRKHMCESADVVCVSPSSKPHSSIG